MDWIDIKTQKPKEGQAVFVWIDKPSSPPNLKTGIYYKWQSFCNETLTAEGDSFRGLEYQDEKKVTHWQPLTIKKPK